MNDSIEVPSANTEVGTEDTILVVPDVSTEVSDAALAAARMGFTKPDADAHQANELCFAKTCFDGVRHLILDGESGKVIAAFYEDVWASVKAAVTVLIDSDGSKYYRASEEAEAGNVGRNLVSQQHGVFKDICLIMSLGNEPDIAKLVDIIEDKKATPTWNRLRGAAEEVRERLIFEPSTYGEDTLTHTGKVKGTDGKMIEKEFNIADTCASHDEIAALKQEAKTLSKETNPQRKGLTNAFWELRGTDMQDKRKGSEDTSTTEDNVVRIAEAVEGSKEGRQLAAEFVAKLKKLQAREGLLSS